MKNGKNMRVLIINYEFPPLGGGGGRACAQIAHHMAQDGNTVHVVTSRFGQLPHFEEKDGYTIERIPSLRKRKEGSNVAEMITFMASSMYKAPKIMRRFQPDCALAFFTLPSGPAAWWLKKIYNLPYAVSLRGGDVPGFLPEQLRFYHRLTKFFIKRIWRQANHVVANSQGLKKLAKENFAGPIHVIENGACPEWLLAVKKIKNQIQPIQPVQPQKNRPIKLLTVGRLVAQKNIPLLLKACQKLKQTSPTLFTLDIVGQGPLENELKTQVKKLGLENQVRFCGWLEKKELMQKYLASDLFALTSTEEGMPNVILEAMTCGLPVVTTNVRGSNELVVHKKNGFVVPDFLPETLAKFLDQLMHNDDLIKEFGRASFDLAKNKTWDRLAGYYSFLLKSTESKSMTPRVVNTSENNLAWQSASSSLLTGDKV